ncbi:MAG: helix-turn-helix transcriptional regulator [Selenomonadaceae bacterium]|nr:helix-turn-helix transcriptional regulator [Selenomonadaceae bacterium]
MNYKRIRALREDKDLRQRELADYLNCSQVAYSYYELGSRDIPTEVLIRLAKFHNTSADYILGLTDEMRPYPPSAKHNKKNSP